MGKLSFFGNFAAIFIVTLGFIGVVSVDKQSILSDIFMFVIMLGPLTLIAAIVLGIIAIVKNKQFGWGIAGVLTSFFLAGMFIMFMYAALVGLASFR